MGREKELLVAGKKMTEQEKTNEGLYAVIFQFCNQCNS